MTDSAFSITWTKAAELESLSRLDVSEYGEADGWDEDYFRSVLRGRKTVGLTVRWEREIVGYIVYEIIHENYRILRLTIRESHRRKGVGREIIEFIASKGRRLLITVPERRIECQLFLRELGFQAIGVLPHWFVTQDGYEMVREPK